MDWLYFDMLHQNFKKIIVVDPGVVSYQPAVEHKRVKGSVRGAYTHKHTHTQEGDFSLIRKPLHKIEH